MDFELDEGAEEVKENDLTRGEAGAMSRVAKKCNQCEKNRI